MSGRRTCVIRERGSGAWAGQHQLNAVVGAPSAQGFVRRLVLEVVPPGQLAARVQQVLEAAIRAAPAEEPGHGVVVVGQILGHESERQLATEAEVVLARYGQVADRVLDVVREVRRYAAL